MWPGDVCRKKARSTEIPALHNPEHPKDLLPTSRSKTTPQIYVHSLNNPSSFLIIRHNVVAAQCKWAHGRQTVISTNIRGVVKGSRNFSTGNFQSYANYHSKLSIFSCLNSPGEDPSINYKAENVTIFQHLQQRGLFCFRNFNFVGFGLELYLQAKYCCFRTVCISGVPWNNQQWRRSEFNVFLWKK